MYSCAPGQRQGAQLKMGTSLTCSLQIVDPSLKNLRAIASLEVEFCKTWLYHGLCMVQKLITQGTYHLDQVDSALKISAF